MTEHRKNISYMPTDGLSYDPAEPKYWDEAALKKEVERLFEVCHGCRLCFKFCDSFPALFNLLGMDPASRPLLTWEGMFPDPHPQPK